MRLGWRGSLCVFVGAMVVGLLLNHFGRIDLAMPTLASIVVLGFAIALKWAWRRQMWFWITMSLFAAFQLLLILFVSWPARWVPALVWTGWATLELYGMVAILDAIGSLMSKSQTSEE